MKLRERDVCVTYDIEPHGKPTLSSSVPGHALVHSSVVHCDDLDDERVHPFFTHQHLMEVIWTNGFTVQVPGHVRCREASHLDGGQVIR